MLAPEVTEHELIHGPSNSTGYWPTAWRDLKALQRLYCSIS